jgi:hypothetical protein
MASIRHWAASSGVNHMRSLHSDHRWAGAARRHGLLPPRVTSFTTTRVSLTSARANRTGLTRASSDSTNNTPSSQPSGFQNLERMLVTSNAQGSSASNPWEEVASCWVLRPPSSVQPTSLVHFVGGAFVGAAPHVLYRKLLEELALQGAVVVATPYSTSFDHLRTVDEIFFEYSRALKALGPEAQMLPSYGLGHSLGSLLQVLMCSRYVVPRQGNILMSFNNKPATDSIPLLSPMIAPSVRALGPILSQLATSPLRSQVEQGLDMLKNSLPMDDNVRQIIPLVEQLAPIYLDVANGTQEFTPSPEESRKLVKDGYAVPKNLLIKFSNDSIDETPILASILQSSAGIPNMELTIKTLPGDHTSPLVQDLSMQFGMNDDVRDSFVEFTSQRMAESESFWNSIGSFAEQATGIPSIAKEQLSGLAKVGADVSAMVAGGVDQEKALKALDVVVDEVSGFIGGGIRPLDERLLESPKDGSSFAE